MSATLPCSLCGTSSAHYFHDSQRAWDYFHCSECDLRFKHPKHHLTPIEERERYELHNNDISDQRYLDFVSPLVEKIKQNHPPSACGLDFGCGENSGLGHSLRQAGFNLQSYDPFFQAYLSSLQQDYDFIAAVEVAEHFYKPGEEFGRLKKMLRANGHLGLMTQIYSSDIDFENWYYRRDPTHVCFYSEKTFAWIQKHFSFKNLELHGNRVAWLTN